MKRRGNLFNPKRKVVPLDQWKAEEGRRMAEAARYGGNPEHKRRPGDYGLTPPSAPRLSKTLCDAGRDFLRAEAGALLRQGFERGMISAERRNDWPQNVWAVSEDGEAFEAQLENQMTGTYHGYPMPDQDPLRSVILEEWRNREPALRD
jgi:hypothetical protein